MGMNVGSGAEGDMMVEMNTTPLIDLMLVLIVMLIMSLPPQTHAVKLDMPVTTPPETDAPPPPVIDIVVDSSATRLRPIALTTITTVVGMIPLAASNPTWGPLAFAVMFGLAFAICLTLILVPMLFYRYRTRIHLKSN